MPEDSLNAPNYIASKLPKMQKAYSTPTKVNEDGHSESKVREKQSKFTESIQFDVTDIRHRMAQFQTWLFKYQSRTEVQLFEARSYANQRISDFTQRIEEKIIERLKVNEASWEEITKKQDILESQIHRIQARLDAMENSTPGGQRQRASGTGGPFVGSQVFTHFIQGAEILLVNAVFFVW
eukprot:CAMPEP_0167770138 /NCGR_PEP_ID=MMETSP0110_2-20121227/17744_1 /TAXON_ID=629695 /ORGANISM="Gymnochlora sp., Strain CCMP2014" /LENGTH=180 /DNA_ID=CAMNT_0007659265 /DNA_START=611 /DNA_END=1150 /DNA_ORIENTATION=+